MSQDQRDGGAVATKSRRLFELNDEQRQLRDTAARVARDRYRPIAHEMDDQRTILPRESRIELAELGYLGIALPERFGGSELPIFDALLVLEEIAKESRPAAFSVFEANTGPAAALNQLGTEDQKSRYLPSVISGEATMAVGISEPDAGSAASDMTTRARRDGDRYLLNGQKAWISGGGHADYYLVYARMNDRPGAKGIGALLVEATWPGFSCGTQERLMGFRGIPSSDLSFDDVEVPLENVVVEPGGFSTLMRSFSLERLGNATMSLAIGQAALDCTIAYVSERKQFGKPLIDFQSVQMQLADMLLAVEAARVLVYRAALDAGAGLPDPLQVSLAKCTSNEMAKRVSDLAIQLHGANGYTEEYGLERLHRDAHGWAIAGGTPAMQRIRILSEALGRRFDQRS